MTGIVRILKFSVHRKNTLMNMKVIYNVKKLSLQTNYNDKDTFAAVLS